LYETFKDIQREWEAKVTNIFGGLQAMHSSNTKEEHMLFPAVMKQYNIPLKEVHVHTALVK
jgi:hypothetical protein